MAGFWKSFASASLLATCLPTWVQGAAVQSVGARVSTSSGLIEGHAAPGESSVSEYLGIPYAQAPTNDLRFASPVAYESNATVQAKAYHHDQYFRRDCPATIGTTPLDFPGFTSQAVTIIKSFAQQLGTSQSEDCLYLNVWTQPKTSTPKPVLVYIHGGRFAVGGANSPFYDGQHLAANEDVVVVTFNYRLNIFGFSGAPGLTQNVALLDQRMAVEWVHKNIAAFGGDPEHITIFGQSAGGASVDYYSYIWTEKPLVSGLISHSGTALSLKPNTAEESASYFYHVSKTLDCGDSSDDVKEVVKCLRQQSYGDILKAVAKVPAASSPALPQPVFHPTVDNVTVFGDYAERSAAGKFAKLPYLVNNNDNEAGYYRVNAFAASLTLTNEDWNQFNLAAFTCPSDQAAKDRAANGVPVWHSRYFGDWDNMRLYPTSGAYHGVDLPMVFGNSKDISAVSTSTGERQFSKHMASAWVAFARDPQKGLTTFGWPQYDAKKNTLIGLAHKNSMKVEFLNPSDFQEGCAALDGDTTPGKGAF
ncbi:carboxylesterase [Aspergillus affinis]|uniref:carboxylesterase n=1 Tax=Aspergillus affinis TaxID=1070780 RepID=UPI0022FF27C9|nr:carboxylesterase [Aspergillus affinis]KAI9043066.1 carboxylesterase [Aspergillus affinis]